jgi:hypothetical protein
MNTDTPDAAPAAQKPAIVLIHGLWLTPLSWEEVADYSLDWALRNVRT